MIESVILETEKIRLEPLTTEHAYPLSELVKDGELWKLIVTSAPSPEDCLSYIKETLHTKDRVAFAVFDKTKHNAFAGLTSFYHIQPEIKRLEIGYTFYGESFWRSHVNSSCKVLLLTHVFESLCYQTVAWQTDILNIRSQNAIERLGAKKDGIIRGHKLRKDGSIRDTVIYSMTRDEWTKNKHRLLTRLAKWDNP